MRFLLSTRTTSVPLPKLLSKISSLPFRVEDIHLADVLGLSPACLQLKVYLRPHSCLRVHEFSPSLPSLHSHDTGRRPAVTSHGGRGSADSRGHDLDRDSPPSKHY